MNKVILMGRLTADPELRQTPNGKSVAQFTVAVNRRYVPDNSQEADFINCISWGKNGENIAKFFCKGKMIAVVGELQISKWNGNDGKTNYKTEVVVNEWDFCGDGKRDNASPADNFEPMNVYETFGG